MSDENLAQNLTDILEKARRSLSASKRLAHEGDYDFRHRVLIMLSCMECRQCF